MSIFLFNSRKSETVVDSGAKIKHSQFFCLLNGEHYKIDLPGGKRSTRCYKKINDTDNKEIPERGCKRCDF